MKLTINYSHKHAVSQMARELGCKSIRSIKCIYFKPDEAVVCQRPNRKKAIEIHGQTGQCLDFVRNK